MKIYSMTATFGKLQHETLRFEDGLNIIEAPNEWGKSTWCAFITAMLYGIDTRQRAGGAVLADKERFAPWSGAAMSGTMEIHWNGKDITIERSGKPRIPFGEFKAYETHSGLPVPELTAANCGQQLLGVERSVFTRAGFIRLQDMPVTQDDSLRRRLNSLVTTGDESCAADTLGKQLRDLKNKCRFNRSGLLPQAEQEQALLQEKLDRLQALQQCIAQQRILQKNLERQIRDLENHAAALRYENAQQGHLKIEEAKAQCQQLAAQLQQLQDTCDQLPTKAAAMDALNELEALQSKQIALNARLSAVTAPPAQPEVPVLFTGLSPAQALKNAQSDANRYNALMNAKKEKTGWIVFALLAVIALLGVAVGMALLHPVPMWLWIGCGALVAVGLIYGLVSTSAGAKKKQEALQEIASKYPALTVDRWIAYAQQYAQQVQTYQQELAQYEQHCGTLTAEKEALQNAMTRLCGDRTPEAHKAYFSHILQQHNDCEAQKQALEQAERHYDGLCAVVSTPAPAAMPDSLTLSQEETDRALDSAHFELKQSQLKMGQCLGQAESFGTEQSIKARLEQVNLRIARLEEYFKALELAQEALYQASSALQRKFAPRISKQAQEYFAFLTDNRYEKLTISDDFSLFTAAREEDVTHGVQWRSDGTADQLYFALRLAVAQALTPDAPLVLDDAFVRFDDERLAKALELLKKESDGKQVLLFSCQSREKHILSK